ncbi:CDP-glycerol glycerophosphotransferase, TagB/SpsB family [Selenomonas ruminantium]|uniref:CDP-glycerol glycerophosphotransferase, TagB/SpsB family n=1 Tax=Selenomonas ruminantium TaxID=971 RepID=A0A1I3CQ86_SELRU|nr:CDP-glycerol glycerophosphotransferase family protein [Selenomonas ruminantium]SFH76553.1 CDP-glycerol glycerophosphotransferase, TagB/SpsB family [Selenomonas ruminantium]
MRLIQIHDEIYKKITKSGVFIINFSNFYLNELIKERNILNRVRGIYDDRPLQQGKRLFNGHEVVIHSYDELKELPDDAICLILSGYYKEIFDKLKNIEILKQKFKEIYFYADREISYDLYYRHKYKKNALHDIVVFRSAGPASHYMAGWEFSDNPRALFEYMLCNGYNKKYELVWLVCDPEKYQEKYRDVPNVKFISYLWADTEDEVKRSLYYYYICLAKFFFIAQTPIFMRNARPDQVRVQLWHGSGFKGDRAKIVDEKRYDYMTVTSETYASIHAKLYGLRKDQMVVTGQPKNDESFHPLQAWRKILSVPVAQKYIFWLPTWRASEIVTDVKLANETGLPFFTKNEQLKELNDLLTTLDMVMVLKLHPSEKNVQDNEAIKDLTNFVVLDNDFLAEKDIQISSLLGNADALISDFSSVAIDYLVLNRPIAFLMDDCEAFAESRTFHWGDIENWLPGLKLYNVDDMKQYIKEVASNIDSGAKLRSDLYHVFHKFRDDKSAERVLQAFDLHL